MGRKGFGFVLVVAVLGVVLAAGQSTADGSVQGNVYRNRYFKISLALPPNLHAVELSSLNVHAPSGKNEVFLFAAREGALPYGIVALAERLNVGSNPIVDGHDFLRRVRETREVGEVIDGQFSIVKINGPTFERLDYETPKVEFDSAIVTRVGDYLLVFRCNAKSKEELNVMVDAVTAMRHE